MNKQNPYQMKSRALSKATFVALFGATVVSSLAFVQPAFAQTSEPAKPDHAKNLQQVMVTAQKKSESEQEVPISMTVVEAADLLNTGASKLDDYYAQIPGLSVNDRGSGRTTLVIRGVSAGQQLNPTVGVMIDDAPFGSSTTDYSISDIDPFDIDHIEVLRGPQGTLYGSSSMGGLIKFAMIDPNSDALSGRVQSDVSSTEHGTMGYAARAAINLPLIKDKLALRISAFHRHDPGYVDDPGQGKHNVNDGDADGGRVSALWNVTGSLKVRASAMAQNSSVNGGARVDMLRNSYTPVDGPYDHRRLPGTDSGNVKTRIYTLQVEDSFGWADFHSVSSYNQYKLVGPQDVTGTFGGLVNLIYGVPGLGVRIDNNNRTGKFTQEFRLSSPDDGRQLSWLGGVFFTNEHTAGYQALVAVDRATGADAGLGLMYEDIYPSTYKEKAAFGNVTYKFTDAFDVQLGGRFSSTRQSFANNYDGPLNGGPSSDSEGASNNVWTYSFSPRYRFNPNVMMYGRVSTGYRAGGANALLMDDRGIFPGQYKSDSLTSYEWGLKGDFADHALTLDTSLFYIDWTNIQLSEVSQATGNSYYVNAGSAKSEGAEASLSWRPLRGLTIAGNAAYTRAVLTEDTPDGTYGRSGDRLPFSPLWSGNLSADYTFPLHGSLDGNVGAGITYVGDRESDFTASAQAQRFMLRSYTTAQLHAGVQSMDWSVSLYVKNLTDARGYLSATAQNATTGVSSYGLLLIQPRTVGVSATYSF
ncbi:TonB-dependent receptor [Rhodanobacter glycinis]|uniref:TonB-dependent receptor n=1 Tax=Rhodanobacter glycinis TaxID=582702 RepID=UPI001375D8DF|nr:TonB-dependent receptor [Rhodanobacter glycinis]